MAQLARACDCYVTYSLSQGREFEPLWGRIIFFFVIHFNGVSNGIENHLTNSSLSGHRVSVNTYLEVATALQSFIFVSDISQSIVAIYS